MMKKLCKDIGVDKKALLAIFMGPNVTIKDLDDSSHVKESSERKEQSISRESGTLNFGALANNEG